MLAVNLTSVWLCAKAGVIGLTRQIVVEYGPRGIRCNAICPSTIPTALVTKVSQERSGGTGQAPSIALGRRDDAAQLAVFLVSEECSSITSQALRSPRGPMTRG